MTISRRVQNELLCDNRTDRTQQQMIHSTSTMSVDGGNALAHEQPIYKTWTANEHARVLEGLEKYPTGPWRKIADHVGTKTARQTMNHAHKYREKLARRQKRLNAQKQRRTGSAATAACYASTPRRSVSAIAPRRSGSDTFSTAAVVSHGVAPTAQESQQQCVSFSNQRPDLLSHFFEGGCCTHGYETPKGQDDLNDIDLNLLMEVFGHPLTPNSNSVLDVLALEPLRYDVVVSPPASCMLMI